MLDFGYRSVDYKSLLDADRFLLVVPGFGYRFVDDGPFLVLSFDSCALDCLRFLTIARSTVKQTNKQLKDLRLPHAVTFALGALTSPSFSCIPVRVIQRESTLLPSFAAFL